MTLEELLVRESIRDTLARYNSNGDRMKIEDFIGVFTDDAVYELGDKVVEGRDAIRAWLTARRDLPADAPRVKFVRHNLTTSVIDVTGRDSATARTYYFVNTDIGPDHCGYYVDRFRPVGDRWLICHRKVRSDWASPDSVFVRQGA
jgi:hypothetical protein